MANEKLIQVVDLCKSYHKLDVIKHISVDFSKNEVVSIIGPSGGGKSTFLRCMNLLESRAPVRFSLMAWIYARRIRANT